MVKSVKTCFKYTVFLETYDTRTPRCQFLWWNWYSYGFSDGSLARPLLAQIFKKLFEMFINKNLAVNGQGEVNYQNLKRLYLVRISWPIMNVWCEFCIDNVNTITMTNIYNSVSTRFFPVFGRCWGYILKFCLVGYAPVNESVILY